MKTIFREEKQMNVREYGLDQKPKWVGKKIIKLLKLEIRQAFQYITHNHYIYLQCDVWVLFFHSNFSHLSCYSRLTAIRWPFFYFINRLCVYARNVNKHTLGYGWIDGWMDGWVIGRTDRRTNASRMNGYKDGCMGWLAECERVGGWADDDRTMRANVNICKMIHINGTRWCSLAEVRGKYFHLRFPLEKLEMEMRFSWLLFCWWWWWYSNYGSIHMRIKWN